MNTANKRRKVGLTVGTVAVIAILIAIAILLPIVNNTFYASTIASQGATFMHTRSGVTFSGNAILNRNNAPDRNFACFDFQRDDSNFWLVRDNTIAGLWDDYQNDTRGNARLREQSYAIREAAANGMMGGSLHVIVHGQGGRAADWSNDGGEPDANGNTHYRRLAYNPETQHSMIETLRNQTDANVYVARSYIFRLGYATEGAFENPQTRQNVYRQANHNLVQVGCVLDFSRPAVRPLISLFPLEANIDSYYDVNQALRHPYSQRNYMYTRARVTSIRDKSRHNILVFESQDPVQSHAFVYNELNAILTMISYDYLRATGRVPLVNFIAHSTGGIWSMMWTNNHPRNVGDIFAIAAPFNGSDIAYAIRNDWLSSRVGPVADIRDMINNPSSFDNSDYRRADALRLGWANAVQQNPGLRLHTMAGIGCISTLNSMIAIGGAGAFAIIFGMIIAGVATIPVTGVLGVAVIAAVVVTSGAIVGQRLIEYVLGSLRAENFRWIMHDDFAVSRTSANAHGFADNAGNIRRRQRRFVHNSDAFRTDLVAHPDVPSVPHNMMTKDAVVISFVQRYFFRFSYYVSRHHWLPSDEIVIMGSGDTAGIHLDFPARINGVPVRRIVDDAFMGRPDLTSVRLPYTMNMIRSFAFYRSSLTNIIIPQAINYIGANAFGDVDADITWYYNPELVRRLSFNTRIRHVVIPNNISTIGNNAFEGLPALRTVTFERDSTVRNIGVRAFARTPNLEAVTLPQSVRYIGDHAFWASSIPRIFFDGTSQLSRIGAGAFTDSGLERIQIPRGLTNIHASAFFGAANLRFVTFQSNSQLRYIGNYSFQNSGIENIQIPRGVQNIGRSAFSRTDDLSSVTFESNSQLRTIEEFVFSRTAITDIQLPHGVSRIESYAFYGSSLATISIPDSVEGIGRGAFWQTPLWHTSTWNNVVYADRWAVGTSSGIVWIDDGFFLRFDTVGIADSAFRGFRVSVPLAIFGVRFIGANAFAESTVPSIELFGVQRIGAAAFRGAHNLEEIFIWWNSAYGITELGSEALDYTHKDLIIRVPDASVYDYRRAPNWNYHAWRIVNWFDMPSRPADFDIEIINNDDLIITWDNTVDGLQGISLKFSALGGAGGNPEYIVNLDISSSEFDILSVPFVNARSTVVLSTVNIVLTAQFNGHQRISRFEDIDTRFGGMYELDGEKYIAIAYERHLRNIGTENRFGWAIGRYILMNNICIDGEWTPTNLSWMPAPISGLFNGNDFSVIANGMYVTQNNLFAGMSVEVVNLRYSQQELVFTAINGGGELMVTAGAGLNETNLIIPSHVDGVPVTAIAADAFAGVGTLESVTIPHSITSVGVGAFANMNSGFSITWYANLQLTDRSGFGAFVREVILPQDTRYINYRAFLELPNVTHVTLPSAIGNITAGTFDRLHQLQYIGVDGDNPNAMWFSQDGVLYFRYLHGAFAGRIRLQQVPRHAQGDIVIPEGVERFSLPGMMQGRPNINSVTIPHSMIYIDFGAFNTWSANQNIYVVGRSYAPSSWNAMWNHGSNARVVFLGA